MNTFYRAIVSLATVFPIGITYVFVFAGELEKLFPEEFVCLVERFVAFPVFLVLLAVFSNLILGFAVVWFLGFVAHKISERPVKIEGIKLLGSDSLLSFLPYVLPLFVSEDGMQGLAGWVIGGLLLLLLSWTSMTISFSPLLRVCGLQFYEAQLADGNVVTLLIKKPKLIPMRIKAVSYITDYCVYGIR